jgi:hypothetical protein
MVQILRLVLTALVFGQPPSQRGDDPASPPRFREVVVDGRALPLADVLRSRGIQVEDDPASSQVVLVADDGRVGPLVCNPASKALFTDARLRDRPARLNGRLHDGLPHLEVVLVRVADPEAGGALRIPEYWCDVCSISVRFDQICPCCQGSMELRMKPEG